MSTLYCRTKLNYVDGNKVVPVAVDVHDARGLNPSLQEWGFEILGHSSAVKDWADEVQTGGIYLDEMEALANRLTGCDAVLFYPGIRRSPERFAEHPDLAPIRVVHSDYAESYQLMLATPDHPYLDILQPSMDRLSVKRDQVARATRIVTLQMWRNVGPRRPDQPLALCDGRSVRRDELLLHRVESYVGVEAQFDSFQVSPPLPPRAHHWYTFPAMAEDELAVFRAFDSDLVAEGLPFWTPHSAFRDPSVGATPEPRESFEIRAICLFW